MKNSFLIILLVGLISCFYEHDSIHDPPVGPGSEEPFLVATDYGLILSWMEPIDGDIHLRHSVYHGPQWSEPRTIARGANWFVNWADFPAIIANGDKLFAHFLEISGKNTYDYDVMYTVSQDRGLNWSKPEKLNSGEVQGEHGFVSGIPYKDGFAVSWLDGRYTKGDNPRMSLRGAIIDGTGVVANEYELDSMTCDCCQTIMVMGEEQPIVYYRDRTIDEVRDIYWVSFSESGVTPPVVLHNDNWEMNACPVNGPAVASDGDVIAVAWYTGMGGKFDVKMKISRDGGLSYGDPILVDGPESFGRVDVQLHNNKILLTYLTSKDNSGSIVLASYDYDGTLLSKLPIATVSPDRRTGFPRTAIWQNELILTWTGIEESKVKLLSVPLDNNQLRTSFRQSFN